jgi:CHASE2 domain-containing sensor protein
MRRILLGIGIILALCVPFLIENAGELSEYLPAAVKGKFEAVGSTYQRWTSGPRSNEARYTAVVTLNESDFPDLPNEACKQRAAAAQLIPLLLQAHAGEIVIDLAFTNTICPESEDKSATPMLRSALLNAAAQVPVVIGQAERKLDELTDAQIARLSGEPIEKNGLILRPVIDLPHDPRLQLSIGLVRLNQDFRKIPLSWIAYEEQNGVVSKPKSKETLAFTAAKLYRAPFPGGADSLDALNNEGRHPLTSLLAWSKFIQVQAAELLCKESSTGAWTACAGGPPLEAKRKLNGKIVLLGWEDNRDDLYTTPAGKLPGVFLQANFIESLLDSRYLHVLPFWWQIGLSLLWFGCIEGSFQIYKRSVERALAGAIAVFIVGVILFYYIAAVNLGFYLALLPPSVAVVLLRCWYQLTDHEQGSDGDHHEDEKPGGKKPDNVSDPSLTAGPRPVEGVKASG